MARPREFDELAALDEALLQFWSHGYEATSTRELAQRMGITSASLYNAFGDKRGLCRRVLERYVERSLDERLRRYAPLAPRAALETFFREIIERSVMDPQHKGCLLVNSALELSPHDAEFRRTVAEVFERIEAFFCQCIKAGQAEGTLTRARPAGELARMLLSVLLGIRVLARSRPERTLLESAAHSALHLLRAQRPKRSRAI
jgi:TetR/AcrR family transcriptional regulator, transcriptional repressor for nem operon